MVRFVRLSDIIRAMKWKCFLCYLDKTDSGHINTYWYQEERDQILRKDHEKDILILTEELYFFQNNKFAEFIVHLKDAKKMR